MLGGRGCHLGHPGLEGGGPDGDRVLAGSAVDRSALEEAGAALVVEMLSELVELLDGAGEH